MKSKNYHNIIENIVQEIISNSYRFNNPAIEDGSMGLAIFYFYCHKYYKDEFYLSKAEEMIEVSIKFLSNISEDSAFIPKYRGDSLSSLIASFGKGLLFVEEKLGYKYDFTEYYEVIDEVLIELTAKSLDEKDFDFFSGALSAGHYFINKFNIYRDKTSQEILLKIYEALLKEAISHEYNQIYWKAPSYADKVYIGISHGSAMIINFLVKLFNIGIFNQEDCSQKQVLNNAVNFVMSQKRNFEMGYFPNIFEIQKKIKPTIYALCYGDLGVLYALRTSSKILNNNHLLEDVDRMLLNSSKREKNSNHTIDSGIFYGASGVYCIYRALFLTSKKSDFQQAYKYWNEQIVTYRDGENSNCAGFTFLFKKENSQDYIQYSFGWGLAGLGICMLLDMDEDLPLLNELLLIGL